MGTEIELKSLIPEGTSDYDRSGIFKLYNRENLFDYMNGGAELYLSYDFQKLLVQRYKNKEREITLEIYEMKTSQDAFGVFSLEQEGEAFQIGDKAFYYSGFLKFWKGNYFVRIVDLGGGDKSKEAITELGKIIADRIDKKGKLPALLSRLPQEGLIPNSERFFHKKIVLDNLYFLSTNNLLNLSPRTDAAMADYSLGKMNLKLLLVSYADNSEARAAYGNFCEGYLKCLSSGKRIIQRLEEDKFIGLELEKNYLWLTFEGKDENKTAKIMQKVKEKIEGN